MGLLNSGNFFSGALPQLGEGTWGLHLLYGAGSCLPPGDDNDPPDVAAIAKNPLVTLGGS